MRFESSLHLAHQQTARLETLLAQWDREVAAEPPITQHQWTNLALWPAARNATVAASTAIEGNPLTIEQVEQVLTGGQVDAARADIREILNYNAALDLANRAALRPNFEWSEELLRRLNAAVLNGLEDDERGEYRRQAVVVGGMYWPPDHQSVPSLMADLVDWLGSKQDEHPLVRAGLTHLNVVSIHPWLNGNGRTARVAGSLMLMRCGIGAPELLNIESDIRSDPARYVGVLQETHGERYQPDRHSATAWLEYFAEICVNRLGIRNRLLAAVPADIGLIAMSLDVPGATALWAPILLGARHAPLRTSALAGALGLSQPRVRAMLGAMASAGWLTPIGERRGRRYGPGPRLLELPLRTTELIARMTGTRGDAVG